MHCHVSNTRNSLTLTLTLTLALTIALALSLALALTLTLTGIMLLGQLTSKLFHQTHKLNISQSFVTAFKYSEAIRKSKTRNSLTLTLALTIALALALALALTITLTLTLTLILTGIMLLAQLSSKLFHQTQNLNISQSFLMAYKYSKAI